MMVLIFFGVVWLLVALEAFRRKIGAVIAVGGGFIVACLSLIPIIAGGKYLDDNYGPKAEQVVQQAPAAPAEQTRGLGLSYDHLMMSMGPFAPEMKPGPTTQDGRTRLVGSTAGGSNGVLEVSGKSLSKDVEKATLLFIFSPDEQASLANTEMTLRYISAVFPEWPSQERYDWLIQVFRNFEGAIVARDGKRLESKVSKQTGMFSFTVTPI